MSNYDLTRREIKWLMEQIAKENVSLEKTGSCGHDLEPYNPDMHGGMMKDPTSGDTKATGALTITGELDHEVSMASTQLDKAAKYSQSMSARMQQIGEQNLPAWVQAKITKASDYISAVYHYMEKYLGEDTGMMQESAEGKINTASHQVEIDVSISKSDMKKLHDGETVELKDTNGHNSFVVNLKAD